MNWFYNLKIANKLLLSFTAVLLLTACLGVVSVVQLAKVNDTATDLATNWMPAIKAATELKYGVSRVRSGALQHLLSDDAEGKAGYEKTMAGMIDKIRQDQAAYEALITEPEEQKTYAEFKQLLADYLAHQERVLALSRENRIPEALALMRGDALRVFNEMEAHIGKIVQVNEAGASAANDLGDVTYAASRGWIIALLAGSITLAVTLAFLVARLISRSLQAAVSVAQTVAAGDLTSDIRIHSSDETGQLLGALKEMNDSLVKIVGEVRSGTETIASASGQIANGNIDLSQRTEEQASSLEETASSMEELTSTVRQNSDNAQQANALANSATNIAARGGAVVAQVVETMGSINESSKKIVDIIAVIDGIAFQTNILALNAAVEAARAGDQGRGFAVVATEVRTLAQRSAAAAKEIKALIDDSVGKVDTGTRLVDQAGATMHEIVESIQRVADIMGEITSASAEQSAGIEQINEAVIQMDSVTQQNAALVEEAAAAAQAMQDQASHLAQAVSVFRLHRHDQRPALRAPARAPRLAFA
ncbi:methyl-accepting chemotaxis protein [Pseudoduganella sp. OTU4001]|uniref:methyl-accepting chemotaxis protein n=1 Tax=Pseudoduganella sp. OTU4001 TaxID=3043854 RepID=UPI00313E4A0B